MAQHHTDMLTMALTALVAEKALASFQQAAGDYATRAEITVAFALLTGAAMALDTATFMAALLFSR